MEFSDQRIRRVLSVFRTLADYMGAHGLNSHDSALHLSGRIGAIGRAVLAPAFVGGVDLESLVLDELLMHAARSEQFIISGTEVRLSPKAAELMSLAIHELATNAVKYGALCRSHATIGVAWEIVYRFGSRRLRFEWLEAGVRIAAGPPLTRGFGSELIEHVIARKLKGEGKLAFFADGVHCTIEIPLGEVRYHDG
jgi:two-component sensor histidine kinase